ncbi:hypothetical protein QQS21_002153 [Conoideocrella luteorostrata]|uniref:Galactosyl transferase GMA12/MNN10 family protein n=1 Tax=Conoideocrella luteorostrata TaxID=1105319 RepID=A0AAJ0CZU5_9HYPO|nr:hypothetical protein QQS21_002153 [Conoideocrella luteorostrata]
MKSSRTTKVLRGILVLLVLLAFLMWYHPSYASQESWTSLTDSTLSQLGVHADVHDEQARIGKISILYGTPSRAYERALQTHKRHNRKHGYPMFIQRVDVLDGYWTKPAFIHYMILRELRKPESQRLQWLFWFDADTIILNYNIAMEVFLPPEQDEVLKQTHVLVADDWNGLNNGVFGIRVSRYAAELFAGVLAYRDFEPDTQLAFQDQSAMELMLKRRKFANHVAKVPQRWFNAYESDDTDPGPSYFYPGDFLVHFAGVPDRETHMNKWADRSEQMSAKWNVPLLKTTYPEDLERFWNRTKGLHTARVKHWTKGTRHLQASIQKVNNTVQEWYNSTENTSENFLSLVKAQESAEYFMGHSTKYADDAIIKDDLHELNQIVMELEDAYRVFSDGTKGQTPKDADQQKKEEEQKKKKEEEEKKKKEEEEEKKKKEEEERKKKEEEEKKKKEEEEEEAKKKDEEEKKKQKEEQEKTKAETKVEYDKVEVFDR